MHLRENKCFSRPALVPTGSRCPINSFKNVLFPTPLLPTTATEIETKTTTTKQEYKRLVCVKINAEDDSPIDQWQSV